MIYSISDIHGDYKQALKLLQRHNVVDMDGNWIANDSTVPVNLQKSTSLSFNQLFLSFTAFRLCKNVLMD